MCLFATMLHFALFYLSQFYHHLTMSLTVVGVGGTQRYNFVLKKSCINCQTLDVANTTHMNAQGQLSTLVTSLM